MVKFKAKLKDSRLIVTAKLSSKDIINEPELDYLSRNYIRGFLRPKKLKQKIIEYTGPTGITLYERLKKPLSEYDFFFIMEQIVASMQKLQFNNLLPGKVVWDTNNIYINESTKEMQFIYVPLVSAQNSPGILTFMESIIYACIPLPDQNTDYISDFTYFLSSLHSFDGEKIEDFIRHANRKVVDTIKQHNRGQSGFIADNKKDYIEHYGNMGTTNGQNEEQTGLLQDEEATGVLSYETETGLLNYGEEETGLLKEDDEFKAFLPSNWYVVQHPILHRKVTGESVQINKPVFRIGKERSYVDLFINNNAVSRSHADIITRGERYFVVDLNSKNRTFINDRILPIQQEVEIFDGDQLRLADEEFVFHT